MKKTQASVQVTLGIIDAYHYMFELLEMLDGRKTVEKYILWNEELSPRDQHLAKLDNLPLMKYYLGEMCERYSAMVYSMGEALELNDPVEVEGRELFHIYVGYVKELVKQELLEKEEACDIITEAYDKDVGFLFEEIRGLYHTLKEDPIDLNLVEEDPPVTTTRFTPPSKTISEIETELLVADRKELMV